MRHPIIPKLGWVGGVGVGVGVGVSVSGRMEDEWTCVCVGCGEAWGEEAEGRKQRIG